MRSVSNAFLDFQLTALFDKIMPVHVRSTAIAPARLIGNSDFIRAAAISLLLDIYLRKPRRSISAR
jgi:hypothetical protein